MSQTTADAPLSGFARFASPAVRAAIRRRLNELGGVVLGVGGLVLAAAVASHDPADPSLSTATDRAPRNLAGRLGAHVSDVLVQGFGWAAWLPALVLLAWALRMFTGRGVSLLPLRVAALGLAMPLLAAAFAVLPGMSAGAAGPLVSAVLLVNLEALLGPIGRLGAQAALGALAVVALYVAFGLSPLEWRRAARATAQGGVAAARVGVRRRHWVTRPLGWAGRSLWAAMPRRRRAEPAADLATVLRAA
ncbi:DNA translocase FtsK 4TM domain-containing protein, partial [Roseococcus sp. DSY-14]|uniref:DNA translocase FtsK 4TM domain-containing protein n=1 Tax=Roseococcus sp. DSY-14 TaxID=3369650 RepID=UPI00387B91DD